MRVAIVINTSWNIYNFRKGLIKALLKRGDEVVAIAPKDDYSNFLVELGCSFEPVDITGTGANPIRDLRTLLSLKTIYKRVKPDIVLHYTIKPNIYGTLVASSLKIPCINNVSGLGTVFLDHSLASIVAKFLYKISFHRASLIFFQNPHDQTDFLAGTGLKNLKMDLLPGSGIDLEQFKPIPIQRSGNFVFLLIARVIVEKGIYEYAEAAATIKSRLPNVEFQLIGSVVESHTRGIAKKEVDSWHESGIINYLGTQNDPREYIANADCIVLPSYREGTPKTLLEAAALAKPIVATDVPGCREVVLQGENGFLCQVKNSEDLAHKLQNMMELDENQRSTMGEVGRKLVEEKFDEQIVIRKYLDQISNIINQKVGK